MSILNTLLEISIYAAAIVTVTMLLKAVFKHRMSPWLHYAVWLVLILRLMLPVTPESGFHVFTAPAQAQSETAVSSDTQSAVPVATDDMISDDIASNTIKPVIDNSSPMSAVSPVSSATPAIAEPLSTEYILLIVWLSGAGLSLLYIIMLYHSLRRRVRKNAAEPTEHLLMLFREVKAAMNIRTNLRLICQYEYGSPALLLPRTVLMPIDTLVSMNDEQIKFALRHELTHYRHRDHITCLLICVLNAVYWFNPFVWLAFRQMRTDMEMACDGAIIKTLSMPQKSRYASLIVSLFAQPERRRLVPGMAQGDAKKMAEQRVRGIFMAAKSRRSAKFISALVAAVLLVSCFTTACQPTPEKAVIAKMDTVEKAIASLPSQTPADIPPQTWSEELTDEATGHIVKIDADILYPSNDSFNVYSIHARNFTQEEVDALVNYFADGEVLYDGEYIETKQDVENMIIDTKHLMSLSQEERDASYGSITEDKLQQRLEDLQKRFEKAPEKVDKKSVSTALTKDKDGYEILETYVDHGGDDDALIEVSNPADESDNALFQARIRDASKGGCLFPLEGTPEQMAQKVLNDLHVDNARLVGSGQAAASNDPDVRKTVTRLFYELTVDELPMRNISAFAAPEELEYAAPIWGADTISIDIGDDGPTTFFWYRRSEITDTVKKNVALMPIEDIMATVRQNIFFSALWPADEMVYPFVISRIELCMAAVPQKDTPGTYLLLPVWNFYGNRELPGNAGSMKDKPFELMDTLISVSAVDGTMLHR